MKLKWQQAPVKTQWGDDMVVASVAIDKDHTLDLYCEREQTGKVDAMFAKRDWVDLTDEEALEACDSTKWVLPTGLAVDVARAVEAKLKEKNQ